MATKCKFNRLINEKSPYLIQHASNPVDWYPWSEEPFNRAKVENKPIFLSIGYSTCHWCHVMAHESFEDKEVAELINKIFIPIKVDREERPDIDKIYMNVCQLLTGSGGWPLTIMLTPDKKPFFAATYLPKESKYGRTGLIDFLPKIKNLWQNKRDEVEETADKITTALQKNVDYQQYNIVEKEIIKKDLHQKAYEELKNIFDKHYGGFGDTPKFPIPHQLLYLIRYQHQTKYNEALQMAEKTLLALRSGGIYDHIGYGFHRYSTDRKWLLPHFEKMIYDQALLAYTYIEAYQSTGIELYHVITEEILLYIERNLLSETGGFFSAEDADSEGIEGKFYLWKIDEIKKLLPSSTIEKFCRIYQLNEDGNYLEESTGERTGHNILYLKNPLAKDSLIQAAEDIYDIIKITIEERELLFNERKDRIHPHKDDKILTDWNGLMIASFARASFVYKNNDYLNIARKAMDFILNKLYQGDKLLHRYRDGDASISANLDDYTFLIWGLIELYQASFRPEYLRWALRFQNKINIDFWDKENGGYFFTTEQKDDLIVRMKEIYDGAIPSGNSVALWNLVRLSHLSGEHRLSEFAEKTSSAFFNEVSFSPSAYSMFLIGLGSLTNPYYDLIIVGEEEDKNIARVIDYLRKKYLPNLAVILISRENAEELTSIAPFLKDYKQVDNQTTFFLCKNYSCFPPVTTLEELKKLIN